MIFETIDDITISYFDEKIDHQTIKQLDKVILSKGAWTTILFLFQEWDRKNESWSVPKASINRYQKKNGQYLQQSKFKFTSAKQASQIIEILQGWLDSGKFEDEEEKSYESP